jgi:hypothetical protein
MTYNALSFNSWPYPTKKPTQQRCSCASCGLFAHSMNNYVVIYSDDNGAMVPLCTPPPFPSPVTALSWFDPTDSFSLSAALLLVATARGRLDAFDVGHWRAVGHLQRRSDCYTALVWSPFSPTTF